MAGQAPDSQTILVVEDAEPVRKMVCSMLAGGGYQYLEAGDGTEALEIALDNRHSFDLALTDIIMPRMGGAEFARHLSRLRPEVRIVFMSGYTDDPVVRAAEAGAAGFLAKPFTSDSLLKAVRRSLDQPWYGLDVAGAAY
jgi:CheY-like chemotaxis protein